MPDPRYEWHRTDRRVFHLRKQGILSRVPLKRHWKSDIGQEANVGGCGAFRPISLEQPVTLCHSLTSFRAAISGNSCSHPLIRERIRDDAEGIGPAKRAEVDRSIALLVRDPIVLP